MVTLEQVKLLESKVVKALSYIETLSTENATLREKLDGYRRRIDELETIVLAFKEAQGRIEAGIISALDRLNQFEDAVERGISGVKSAPEEHQASPAAPAPAEVPLPPETPAQSEAPVESMEPFQVPASEEPAEDEEPTLMEMPEEKPIDDKNGELDIF